jgi:hypothetical protein
MINVFTRRSLGLMAIALGLLCLLVVGAIALPTAGAAACPICYGFEQFQPKIFVEPVLPQSERGLVAAIVQSARERVRTFYGSLESDPGIFVCATDSCYDRFGRGKSRGVAYYDLALVLSPRGIDPVIAAHELSHIEAHRRVGFLNFVNNAVPAWFNEGLATVVADDPRYLAALGAADRCLVAPRVGELLPTRMSDWRERAGTDHLLYAKAACQVSQWLATNGGSGAAVKLLSQIAMGTPFAEAYR